MSKPTTYWEGILDAARKQKTRYLSVRGDLAPLVLVDQPSRWTQDGGRWVQKDPRLYRHEITAFQRNRVKWARVNRSLARVERSILHAMARLACQKDVWGHLREGAKETAREVRRRCNEGRGKEDRGVPSAGGSVLG